MARSNARIRGPWSGSHNEWSLIHEARARPLAEMAPLLDLLADVSRWIREEGPACLEDPRFPPAAAICPGEHYLLLRAICDVVGPSRVVEIGTASGGSAAVMLTSRRVDRIDTYDVEPWDRSSWGRSLLRVEDFGERLEQHVVDLGDAAAFDAHVNRLARADLVFADGPKDGVFEQRFLPKLLTVLEGGAGDRPALVVLDDIRVRPMQELWRDVTLPKMDFVTLGHFSGTGVILVSRSTEPRKALER